MENLKRNKEGKYLSTILSSKRKASMSKGMGRRSGDWKLRFSERENLCEICKRIPRESDDSRCSSCIRSKYFEVWHRNVLMRGSL